MFSRHHKSKNIWKNKRNQQTKSDSLNIDYSFDNLKSMSQRIGIINRLQQKQWNKSEFGKVQRTIADGSTYQYQKGYKSMKRPSTSVDTGKIRNMNTAVKAFKHQKLLNQAIITQKGKQTLKTGLTCNSQNVKQGLLGEYQRYNQMSKHELIEKLISLEYLANNIFRKNKTLQQKIRSFDPNYK